VDERGIEDVLCRVNFDLHKFIHPHKSSLGIPISSVRRSLERVKDASPKDDPVIATERINNGRCDPEF
jgi:hypothetical protein